MALMKTNHRLIIDLVVAVVYLIAANPAITGLFIHEWVSLGILVVLIVHAAASFDSIRTVLRRRDDRVAFANLILDAALLIVFMVVTVSGIMVSRHILPLFGYVAPGYFFWNPLHSISAKILLALLIIHVVAHFRWFASLLPKGKKALSRDKEPVDETGLE
jgi:hypothetical protein